MKQILQWSLKIRILRKKFNVSSYFLFFALLNLTQSSTSDRKIEQNKTAYD